MKPPFPELTATVAVMPTERELREQLRLANRLVYGLRAVIILAHATEGMNYEAVRAWYDLTADLKRWEHLQS